MDVARGDKDIGDEIILYIDCPVIQIEEAFRLSFANHISAVRIGRTSFYFLVFLHLLFGF